VAAHVHGESGLDGPVLPEPTTEPVAQAAADFLAERIVDGTVLVPTGPLTNVAQLLERHPDAAGKLAEIVLMGGAIAEGNMTPAAEFNIWADPEAAQAVFHSGIDVVMVGLDVTHRALLTSDDAERLRSTGPIGAFVADLVEFFKRYHQETYGWDGAPIHDAVAVAEVIQPGLVTTRLRNVEVETVSELCRGRTVVDLWRRTDREPNARVGVGIDAEGFFRLLTERIARLG
jgi:inosine-uridine nucleoside N-ribohydrolase